MVLKLAGAVEKTGDRTGNTKNSMTKLGGFSAIHAD